MAQTNPLGTIRLSGLSSGIDTDLVVKSMLFTMQSKVDKQNQTTTKLEWKADALREINSLIKTFRESNMSVLNPDSNMLSASAYSAFSVSMLTQTSAVTVTAGASALAGKITINNITQLASSATMKGAKNTFAGESLNPNAKLADLELANALEFEDGSISFSINGQTFTFTEETTLSSMMNTINSSDAGVKMTYSSLTKGFTITSKTTGSASKVEIENLTGNAFSETDSAFGIAQGAQMGQDAILKINDVEVIRSNNTFTIDGITYALNDESVSEISFNVTQDVEGAVKKITTFIKAYNELITKMQNVVEEKVYRAFPPLTDAQKAEMSETEIKMWEEKAKSGLLRNNSELTSLLSTMRTAFYTTVEGIGISPSDIGLSTGHYSDRGKITVDETKLRTALQNNPDAVSNVFTAKGTSSDSKEAFAQSGLVVRLSDALLQYTSSVTSNTLTALQEQISDSEDIEDSLLDKLSAKEAALYARFSAMEKALSTLNSQTTWLSSLFTSS